MRTKQLESLIAISEKNSFAGAAEAMNLTVPAITKSMRSMEEEVGVPLFDKSGYRVKLNEAGESFLQYAHIILSDFEEAKLRAQNIYHNEIKSLSIYAGPAICRQLVPVVSCAFLESHPDVTIDLKDNFLRDDKIIIYDDIKRGKTDLALSPIPDDLDPKGLTWEPLLRMQLQIVVHRSHPILQIPNFTFSDLYDYRWLIPSKNGFPYDETVKLFHEFGSRGPDYFHVTPIIAREAMLKMLRIKPFVAILPNNDQIYTLDTSEFAVLDIDTNKFGWTVFAIRRNTKAINPLIDEYIQAVKTVINNKACLI